MILPAHQYRKVMNAKRWFFTESAKHPQERSLLRKHTNHEFLQMTRTMTRLINMTKKQSSSKASKFKFQGYVNINISEAQTPEFLSYLKDHDRVWNDYAQCLVDGYAIKANFDAENANYRVSVTGFEDTGDNYGFVIGGFADDWFTALAVVLFKHYYVSKENWQSFHQPENKRFG